MPFITNHNSIFLKNSVEAYEVEQILNNKWNDHFDEFYPNMNFDEFYDRVTSSSDYIIIQPNNPEEFSGWFRTFEVYSVLEKSITLHESEKCTKLKNSYPLKQENDQTKLLRNSGTVFIENYILGEYGGLLHKVEGEVNYENFSQSFLGRRGFSQCYYCSNFYSEDDKTYWTDEQWEAHDRVGKEILSKLTPDELNKWHGIKK